MITQIKQIEERRRLCSRVKARNAVNANDLKLDVNVRILFISTGSELMQ